MYCFVALHPVFSSATSQSPGTPEALATIYNTSRNVPYGFPVNGNIVESVGRPSVGRVE